MKPPTFLEVAVVGMHFRGADVKELVNSLIYPVNFELEREPFNEYDSLAIKVIYPQTQTHIGYLERGQAAFIAPWMDDGFQFICVAGHGELRKNSNIHPICTISPADE